MGNCLIGSGPIQELKLFFTVTISLSPSKTHGRAAPAAETPTFPHPTTPVISGRFGEEYAPPFPRRR
jgi:hypothetical protein